MVNINKASIITIGNEILSGKTIDTNSAFIAAQLTTIGIPIVRIISVGDGYNEIVSALKEASECSDLVICTGGLGPTRDDITKKTVAQFLGRNIIVDQEQLKIVKEKFRKFGYTKMPDSNISQAEIIEGSIMFPNPRGTAPGLFIEKEKNLFFIIPGVPMEMEGLVKGGLVPYLKENLPEIQSIISRTIRTIGIGESKLAEMIDARLPENMPVEIAYLPDLKNVDIRLTARGTDSGELQEEIKSIEKILDVVVGDSIYGYGEQTFESVLAGMLIERKLKVATAESCTGGLIGDRLTSVSGSSDYFDRGVITYSNQAKYDLAGVNPETIEAFGAVSEEVAREMAEGIFKKSKVDLGISSTGIAGPTGGTDEKPVGLVYLGLAHKDGTKVTKVNFGGNRERIKQRTAQAALYILWKFLND